MLFSDNSDQSRLRIPEPPPAPSKDFIRFLSSAPPPAASRTRRQKERDRSEQPSAPLHVAGMPDVLPQLLGIARERWAFSPSGLVCLLEKVIDQRIKVTCTPSLCCNPDCSCTGGCELPIFFTKFVTYIETDTLLISRPLLLKCCVLCAEVRLLLQRTALHAQSLPSPPLCQSPLQKFGFHLRSIVCSVSRLLLQIIIQTDEAIHGSGVCATLLRELLLLAQFLQTCLALPAVASSYSACTSFAVPALMKTLVSPDMIPPMTLPHHFSDLLFKRCQDNLQRVFTPTVDTTEELHALLSAARLLQLLSAASAALLPTTTRPLPNSTPATLKLGLATCSSAAQLPSSDDACVQLLNHAAARVCNLAFGSGLPAPELHLFALCVLPVFVVSRDRSSCGMKEFTTKMSVHSEFVTRCVALADLCMRASLDGAGSSSSSHAAAAFAFFRALGPMVAALPSPSKHSVAPNWIVASFSSPPSSEGSGSCTSASPDLKPASSLNFLSHLEQWRRDPLAHLASDCSRVVPLPFSENLKNFLSAWILGCTGGGLKGLVERHAAVLASTEQFADNLHRTLHFCANECHPSAAQPGMEYCAAMLSAAPATADESLSSLATDAVRCTVFDGVARYFAHGLGEADFVESLNAPLKDQACHSPRINLQLSQVIATMQSSQAGTVQQLTAAAAAEFIVALCRMQGSQRKTVPLVPLTPSDRLACSVALPKLWEHLFAALQQSEAHDSILLLLKALTCIVEHDWFYSGSMCQGVKEVDMLQPASLVHNMIFADPHVRNLSNSSSVSSAIISASALLTDARTLFPDVWSSANSRRACDRLVSQIFAVFVLCNKVLAGAVRRSDCIDATSVRLSALWTDDATFDADLWKPHALYEFVCCELMPFLLQFARKFSSVPHLPENFRFQLGEWCCLLLLLLSHVNLIRRSPPCRAEMEILFSGIFPLLDLVSDSSSLHLAVRCLADVVSISIQPAVISTAASLLLAEPSARTAAAFFRSSYATLLALCRQYSSAGSSACRNAAQTLVQHLFRSFNAAMAQQRAASSRLVYSFWESLSQHVELRRETHKVDLQVQAEAWPIALSHHLTIGSSHWSHHLNCLCANGLEPMYLLADHYAAQGADLHAFDEISEAIASLVTYAAQNLLVNVLGCSLPLSDVIIAQSTFFNTCESLVQHLSAAHGPALDILRRVLLQSTSSFSAASFRTLGPPMFLDGWVCSLAYSITHAFPASDELVSSRNSRAVLFEDHPVFGKKLEMQTLFITLIQDKKIDSSMLLSDAIRMFLRDNNAVLPLLLSFGLSLHKRDYCHVPKNCTPSLLKWLRWLASSPHAHDASRASIAQDILLLLPDLDNFFTLNLHPSSSYRSMKSHIHDRLLPQSVFEGALHAIVDSSFYSSPSLVFLNHCAPNGKFALFRPSLIAALCLPSELVSQSFSFLLFLLGRSGQRVNFGNSAVHEGLFPTAFAVNCAFHSKLEELIKLMLHAADFEASHSDLECSSRLFTPKSGSAAKVSLLVDFLACSPCLTSMSHDLAALEFMLFRPPHADFGTLQANFHCVGFLKDLFAHATRQQLKAGIEFSAPVIEVARYVSVTESAVADLGDWMGDVGSVLGTSKFMWLVNSRLVIYLQRQLTLFLGVFSSMITKIDASALPANLSTLCGLFGSFFRLLALILHWKLNFSMEDAMITCNSFVGCIVQQKAIFCTQPPATAAPSALRRNCQAAESSLFSESIRAVVHVLSLLCANHSVSTMDVAPALLKILKSCEVAGITALSDSVMQTIAKVCFRAAGLKYDCLTQARAAVISAGQVNPSQEILAKVQHLVVIVCEGAPSAAARCRVALTLFRDLLPLCGRLPCGDRRTIATVCALALQFPPQIASVTSVFDCQELHVWAAAAELAHSLLLLSQSEDETCHDGAANAPIMNIVHEIVRALGTFLQHQLVETPSHATTLALCCEVGIKFLHSAVRFAWCSTFNELPTFPSKSFFSLLQLACGTDLSGIDSRNNISVIGGNSRRSSWAGVANIGNTCYAASVLQQLVSIPCFVAALFDASLGPLTCSPHQSLLLSLQAFCSALLNPQASQVPCVEPLELYARCSMAGSNVLHIADTTAQSQDAAEFFVTLINQLNAETSASACVDAMVSSPRVCTASLPVVSSSIAELFAVSATETFRWPACGCTRQRTEDSVILTATGLETQDATGESFSSIDAALRSHFSSSTAQRCCNCGSDNTSQCTTMKCISRASNILLMQLRCDSADGACSKIFEQPSFPLILDIHHVSREVKDTEYELEGVVLHHGLSMTTGHYTAVVRDVAAAEFIWGWHLNDAKAPEPVTHSAIRDITSRDGRRVDLDNINLLYSGKPYLLVYVRRQHLKAQPARSLLSGDFFGICKIATTRFGGVKNSASECINLQVLRFCLHAAPACVRSAQSLLRQLLCLFADTMQSTGSHEWNILASELLSAANVTDSAVLIRSFIPFYLMSRELSRGPELRCIFLFLPHAPLSPQDCSPTKFGPYIFVALLSAAHVSPSELDCACNPLIAIFDCITSCALNVQNIGGVCESGSKLAAVSDSHVANVFAQLQPARILSAARAAAAALMDFNRITKLPSHDHSSANWLVGLAEKDSVERVCQHLEHSGAVASLISLLQDSSNDAGFKRSRAHDTVSTDSTVWEQLVLLCNSMTGACASDAEWL